MSATLERRVVPGGYITIEIATFYPIYFLTFKAVGG